MKAKTTTDKLPAVFSIDRKEQWYLESADATYQGTDAENLFLLLCDLVLDAIEELPEDKKLLSQITII